MKLYSQLSLPAVKFCSVAMSNSGRLVAASLPRPSGAHYVDDSSTQKILCKRTLVDV
jgi:hypothetical protein